jgi:hypothetical protein
MGRLAQRQSARFTPGRSLVQIQYRPQGHRQAGQGITPLAGLEPWPFFAAATMFTTVVVPVG